MSEGDWRVMAKSQSWTDPGTSTAANRTLSPFGPSITGSMNATPRGCYVVTGAGMRVWFLIGLIKVSHYSNREQGRELTSLAKTAAWNAGAVWSAVCLSISSVAFRNSSRRMPGLRLQPATQPNPPTVGRRKRATQHPRAPQTPPEQLEPAAPAPAPALSSPPTSGPAITGCEASGTCTCKGPCQLPCLR